MSQLTGYDPRVVARQEIGAILKQVAGRVKVAPDNVIPFKARLRAAKSAFGTTKASKNPYGISVNTGRRGAVPGRVWYRTENRKFQMIGEVDDSGSYDRNGGDPRHIKPGAFSTAREGISRYITELAKAFPDVKNAIGLSRQSVVQMADGLGISLENVPGGGARADAIAKARAAMASNGQRYTNGKGSDQLDATGGYLARIMNSLPYNTKVNIDGIFASVMAARAKRFMAAHEAGAFKSVAALQRKYPWVKIVGAPPAIPAE